MSVTPIVIVHGGSRAIAPNEVAKRRYKDGVLQAARIGYETLLKGGSAVDAVELAVRAMEDDPIFNAGHGSAVTEDTTVEVDALIMDGSTLDTGAVGAVQGIANPISLARRVMEDTPHCLLVSEGAVKFAKQIDFPVLQDPKVLITQESHARTGQGQTYEEVLSAYIAGKSVSPSEQEDSSGKPCFDTVGAVAMDVQGRLACASSTGGLPLKMLGRVGDSPLVGCGGYANPLGASTTTGHGESLMKTVLAREVVRHMENGCTAQEACDKGIKENLALVEGDGGVIAVDRAGTAGHAFNTQSMTWSAVTKGVMTYGFEKGEERTMPYTQNPS